MTMNMLDNTPHTWNTIMQAINEQLKLLFKCNKTSCMHKVQKFIKFLALPLAYVNKQPPEIQIVPSNFLMLFEHHRKWIIHDNNKSAEFSVEFISNSRRKV